MARICHLRQVLAMFKEGKLQRSKEMLNEIETIIPGVESPEIVSIKNAAREFLKTINRPYS